MNKANDASSVFCDGCGGGAGGGGGSGGGDGLTVVMVTYLSG